MNKSIKKENICCRVGCDDQTATVRGWARCCGELFFCDDCYEHYIGLGLNMKRLDGEPLGIADVMPARKLKNLITHGQSDHSECDHDSCEQALLF